MDCKRVVPWPKKHSSTDDYQANTSTSSSFNSTTTTSEEDSALVNRCTYSEDSLESAQPLASVLSLYQQQQPPSPCPFPFPRYNLTQMPANFAHVPAFLRFNLPGTPGATVSLRGSYDRPQVTSAEDQAATNLSLDQIEYLSYQICQKLPVQLLLPPNKAECLRFLARHYVSNLLPLHLLGDFAAAFLPLPGGTEHFTELLPQLMSEMYQEALAAIRRSIAGRELYICLANSTTITDSRVEAKKAKGGKTMIHRLDVFIGVLGDPEKRYLLKSVPLLKENAHLSDQFVLDVLLDAMNLLWPDQSWLSESKNICLLLTDYGFEVEKVICDLRRTSPSAFSGTVHLYQFEQLLVCLGDAINRWYRQEAKWTLTFMHALLRTLSTADSKFERFFLRRCYNFVMKSNGTWSYQELLLHLYEHFAQVQMAFCTFRTGRPSEDRQYTVATFTDEEFSQEFNLAVVMAHLSLLISKCLCMREGALGEVSKLVSQIIGVLRELLKVNDDVRSWAETCDPVCVLLNGHYETVFSNQQQPETSQTFELSQQIHQHRREGLQSVLLGGLITFPSVFPLTSSLLLQFPVPDSLSALLSIVYASSELQYGDDIARTRLQMDTFCRFGSYYYCNNSGATVPCANGDKGSQFAGATCHQPQQAVPQPALAPSGPSIGPWPAYTPVSHPLSSSTASAYYRNWQY